MKFSTEYGYLIKALREYPFTKQVNERLLEIKYPVSKTGNDPNWWIQPQNMPKDPKILSDIIRIESDPVLNKYRRYQKGIKKMIEETDNVTWRIIKAVYINEELTVEGAMMKYSRGSKNSAYRNMIKPFFEKLEYKINEVIAEERFVINFGKSD